MYFKFLRDDPKNPRKITGIDTSVMGHVALLILFGEFYAQYLRPWLIHLYGQL